MGGRGKEDDRARGCEEEREIHVWIIAGSLLKPNVLTLLGSELPGGFLPVEEGRGDRSSIKQTD